MILINAKEVTFPKCRVCGERFDKAVRLESALYVCVICVFAMRQMVCPAPKSKSLNQGMLVSLVRAARAALAEVHKACPEPESPRPAQPGEPCIRHCPDDPYYGEIRHRKDCIYAAPVKCGFTCARLRSAVLAVYADQFPDDLDWQRAHLPGFADWWSKPGS